ncbi:hypothetical protein [Paenibacillus sp. L3-i20]|uniref:Orn/Lys/Arg family decarboxylase n=1 Tax=Paenibacillus sp. L3-i20 TaxID=2905833 RepID=UPI001EDF44EA|nr:hypothetical protein [Paenibacillus sp. L3-i20]GKU79408.1 hypothetical protein L3i20_v238050 [Paenibacillus sp. L3-i20]
MTEMFSKGSRGDGTERSNYNTVIPAAPQFLISPREAIYSTVEHLELIQSHGYICAEFIYVYTPGILILMPGQLITRYTLDYNMRHIEAGLPVKGLDYYFAKDKYLIQD